MAFLNYSLLWGAALLAIPIVLHLMLRQQPRSLVFPALRLVRQRQESNRRQLQLRHWLLLLLRCLVIALLAVALARPSVRSPHWGDWGFLGLQFGMLVIVGAMALLALLQGRSGLVRGGLLAAVVLLCVSLAWSVRAARISVEETGLGSQRGPVAAVLVFDTSPRMRYVWQNQTRLEQAAEIAGWLLGQLPSGSEVAVVDSRPAAAAFAADRSAAARSIERLETTWSPVPLPQVLARALELVRTSSQPRREIYTFTDLTRGAWTEQPAEGLASRLAEADDVLLYVVDVGSERPQNTALGELQLSAEVLPQRSELMLEGSVSRVGAGESATIELYVEQPDPELPLIENGRTRVPEAQLRDQRIVELEEGESRGLRFRLSGLELGTHQGWLEIAGQDGLEFDDRRYFTVEVQEALPVLVLAPPGVNTRFFTEAVAPFEFRETGRAQYACTVMEQAQLPNVSLDDYAAVCLLDPTPLVPLDWERLLGYVQRGGGLGIFLGHNAEPSAFSGEPARQLLGGDLSRPWRTAGDVFLTFRDLSHPVTAAFRDVATAVPWDQFPVHRHWGLDEILDTARLVMPYSNHQAALVEVTGHRGRVLTMTTPVSDPLRPAGRSSWNELPTGSDAWPYFVLVNEMLAYLVDAGGVRLNYLAGETAVLPNARDRRPERYQLFTPLGQLQEVTAVDDQVSVRFTSLPGPYRLKGHRGGPVVRGFSVNLPETASCLERLDREALDPILGPDRYHYARDQQEIVWGVGQARRGREFYPILILLVALVLGLEHLLANRFYRPAE